MVHPSGESSTLFTRPVSGLVCICVGRVRVDLPFTPPCLARGPMPRSSLEENSPKARVTGSSGPSPASPSKRMTLTPAQKAAAERAARLQAAESRTKAAKPTASNTVAARARARNLAAWFDAGLHAVVSDGTPHVSGVLELPPDITGFDNEGLLLTHQCTGVQIYPTRLDLGFGHRPARGGITIWHFTRGHVLRSVVKSCEGSRVEREAALWETLALDCRDRWALSQPQVWCTRSEPADFDDFSQIVSNVYANPLGKTLSGRSKEDSCTHAIALRVPSMDWLERPTRPHMPFAGEFWRLRSIKDMLRDGASLPGYTDAELRILLLTCGSSAPSPRGELAIAPVSPTTTKSMFGWTKRAPRGASSGQDPASPKSSKSPKSPKSPISPASTRSPASPMSRQSSPAAMSPPSPTSPSGSNGPVLVACARSLPTSPEAERLLQKAEARRLQFAAAKANGAGRDPSNVLDDGEEMMDVEVGQTAFRQTRRRELHVKSSPSDQRIEVGDPNDVQRSVIETMKQMRAMYPLHTAAVRGDLTEMRRLIEGNTFVDARQPELVNRTALHAAVEDGRIEACELLVLSRADIALKTSFEHTPLTLAIDNSNAELVEFFLHEQADVHQGLRDEPLLHRALSMPTRKFKTKIVEMLVSAKADVQERYEDQIPLLKAVTMTRLPAVKAILRAKASPNVCMPASEDSAGSTPLQVALRSDNRPLARMLLNSKADLKQRDLEGNDAYFYIESELLWGWLNEVTCNHRPWVPMEIRLLRKRERDAELEEEERERRLAGDDAIAIAQVREDDE